MKWLLLALGLALTGCAVFEQTPEDIQQKLTNPGSGQLYERDPLTEY